MRTKSWCLLIVLALAVSDAVAQRTPLTHVDLTRIDYPLGGSRERFNAATKKWEKYSLEQKIAYEDKTGDFLLQWNGLDGKRKTIAYRPATRLYVTLVARIEKNPSNGALRYTYAVRNLPNSQRELQALYVETKAAVVDVKSPDGTWGHSAPFTDYLTNVLKAEAGWTWARTASEKPGLLPGEGTYGFSFQSEGLPAPVKCFAANRRGMKGIGEDPPEELMAALDPVTWFIPSGITVGPVAPPENLEPAAHLRNVRQMVDVAVQQGWILSPAVAREVKDALTRAIDFLNSGHTTSGRETLEGLMKRVEEERERILLSEAYAIIRYNLEFVLAKAND